MTGDPPADAIAGLASDLIRLPSQGGIDPPGPVLDRVARELTAIGLKPSILKDGDEPDGGRPVAVVAILDGGRPGPAWALNACIDTAPAGDRSAWTVDPFAGEVRGTRLYGRGAADCKIAVATFVHLAGALAARRDTLTGRLVLLFDADEHTGRFGGVRTFMAARPSLRLEDLFGVMIGYPENEAINIGARGFWRARLTVFGRAEHTGAAGAPAPNAAIKAAALVSALEHLPLPVEASPDFPLPPRLTVTGLTGGVGFSTVPDRAEVSIDLRLTPRFDAKAAHASIAAILDALDRDRPSGRPSEIDAEESWPPYRLPDRSPLAGALREAATDAAGRPVPGAVCGPSNIGNFLAAHGVEATCGFGVTCGNVHGADEWADLATLPLVWRAYQGALARLMGGRGPKT